jgi:hypothetical protein
MALCEIQWVTEFRFTAQKVNHIDEIPCMAITSGASFGQLHLTVNAFQNAVGDARFDEVNDARPMLLMAK